MSKVIEKEKLRENLEEFREKIRETREEMWIKDALRARKFSNIETFKQGLDLINFALKISGAGMNADNR